MAETPAAAGRRLRQHDGESGQHAMLPLMYAHVRL